MECDADGGAVRLSLSADSSHCLNLKQEFLPSGRKNGLMAESSETVGLRLFEFLSDLCAPLQLNSSTHFAEPV